MERTGMDEIQESAFYLLRMPLSIPNILEYNGFQDP